jgi:hypothetical protein
VQDDSNPNICSHFSSLRNLLGSPFRFFCNIQPSVSCDHCGGQYCHHHAEVCGHCEQVLCSYCMEGHKKYHCPDTLTDKVLNFLSARGFK